MFSLTFCKSRTFAFSAELRALRLTRCETFRPYAIFQDNVFDVINLSIAVGHDGFQGWAIL